MQSLPFGSLANLLCSLQIARSKKVLKYNSFPLSSSSPFFLRAVFSGVPQDFITEFYFLIFLSDLSNISLSSELFMYADIILFKFFYPFDAFAACSALNKDLKFIAK